ncbi:MAG: hypothetical protein KC656_26010, partial [Myxococcales bacterium]|nr:hypothetical protein [Myxococcales bacterium]
MARAGLFLVLALLVPGVVGAWMSASASRLEEAETPEIAARVRALREENPMLGWRGCRLGLLRPE